MNPNDSIRQKMLEYFYERNHNSTSQMGKKGSAAKVSDIKRELKEREGLSQREVSSNLTYLIGNDWVKVIDLKKEINVKGNIIPQVTTFYQITPKGIDKIEGGSAFEFKDRYSGINITAAGSNIITLGDGNIVHSSYSELRESLDVLKTIVSESDKIKEPEKLSYAVDIESIKDQLAKEHPNRPVIKVLWDGLKTLSSVMGIAESIGKVGELINPIIGV